MPALRERAADIPLLVHHFLEKVCRHEEIPVKQTTSETLDRLAGYSWPGNVRQLENAVEMAVALSGDRHWLYPGDFPLPSPSAERPSPVMLSTRMTLPEEGLDFERTVGTLELDLLRQALDRSGGNKKLAADLLRLKRTTLAAKLKSFESPSGTYGA
jgi:DNA-binding NtrC family response regulator